MHRGGDRTGNCESCGAQLAPAQRYCVHCGERMAPRSELLLSLLRRGRARGQSPAARAAWEGSTSAAAGSAAAERAPSRPRRVTPGERLERVLGGFALPGRRTSALLVLGFLGFGILVGDVAATKPGYALSASTRRPVKLIIPATSASGGSQPSTGTGETAPPPTTAESTPEASEPSSAETTSKTSSSKSGSSKSGSSSTNSEGEAQEGSSNGSGSGSGSGGSSGSKFHSIKHVFVIALSEQPFASAFGPSSPAPYLSHTLEHRGELLVRYYGVAHGPLANAIALVSGQGPTPATVAGCPTFADVLPGSAGAKEQVAGEGCVYPAGTKTVVGELARKHLKARAYVQGIDEAGSASGACAHPPLGSADATATPASTSPYTTGHNPFVYFHSVIDGSACASEDVGLATLATDLRREASTPALSYIVPDRCDDGSPSPCAPGTPAGMVPADGLLKRIVPEILGSRAYRKNGLLVITVDGAPASGEFADTSSCCGQPRFPNLPPPTGKAALLGPEGGGQVGALLLSPFVKGGAVSQETYNHFSLLRTIEDLFGLPHLGYAGLPKVSAFEAALFSAR